MPEPKEAAAKDWSRTTTRRALEPQQTACHSRACQPLVPAGLVLESLEREEYARTLDFLAIVAHDLRDLIGGIVTSAALLSKRAPQNEDGNNILAETKRIEQYRIRRPRPKWSEIIP